MGSNLYWITEHGRTAFRCWFIVGAFSKGLFWMRFGSLGFAVTNHAPLFSERIGKRKKLRIGFGWRLRFLK